MAWETWRCPTCLTVLPEGTEKRCPGCHAKLRKSRSQPIVLGNTSRLDLQTTLPIERQNRKRLERGHWNLERPTPVREPVAFVEPEAEAVLVLEPEPEPEVLLVERGRDTGLWFDETAAEPVATPPYFAVEAKRAELARDVNSVVDALHRKARGRPARRSLRLMASASSNRSRWNTEFKNRHGDDF